MEESGAVTERTTFEPAEAVGEEIPGKGTTHAKVVRQEGPVRPGAARSQRGSCRGRGESEPRTERSGPETVRAPVRRVRSRLSPRRNRESLFIFKV